MFKPILNLSGRKVGFGFKPLLIPEMGITAARRPRGRLRHPRARPQRPQAQCAHQGRAALAAGRYFRVKNSNNQSFIVMDAPPEKEDCHPFVEITKAWREQGVLLPELFAIDLEQGFLLLEDFGAVRMP